MEEGRVYTHGTLSAVRRRSDRAGAALSSERLPSTDHPPQVLECCLWKALERTAHASASLVTRYDGARPAEPPPWPPMWSQRPLQEDLSRYAENQPTRKHRHTQSK